MTETSNAYDNQECGPNSLHKEVHLCAIHRPGVRSPARSYVFRMYENFWTHQSAVPQLWATLVSDVRVFGASHDQHLLLKHPSTAVAIYLYPVPPRVLPNFSLGNRFLLS